MLFNFLIFTWCGTQTHIWIPSNSFIKCESLPHNSPLQFLTNSPFKCEFLPHWYIFPWVGNPYLSSFITIRHTFLKPLQKRLLIKAHTILYSPKSFTEMNYWLWYHFWIILIDDTLGRLHTNEPWTNPY